MTVSLCSSGGRPARPMWKAMEEIMVKMNNVCHLVNGRNK